MEDLQYVYQNFFTKLKSYISSLPVLIVAFLAYFGIMMIFNRLTFSLPSGVNIFMGFIRWFLRLAIMSHLASLLQTMVIRGQLRFQDLLNFDNRFVGRLSQVFFIFYLIELFVSRSGILGGVGPLAPWILLIWAIFTAPAFEAVHLGNENMSTIFQSLIEYWTTNILALLPYLAVSILIYLFVWQRLLVWAMVATNSFILAQVLYAILGSVLMALFMLTRDILFRETYFSNPRSRKYKGGF